MTTIRGRGIYEREFRGILEADDKILAKIVKTCSVQETENYLKIRNFPFFVVRAAGSYGIDIIAIRGELSLAIEVKATHEAEIHLSRSYLKQQLKTHLQICSEVKLCPIYAYRMKGYRGDAWRLFTFPIPDVHLKGIQSLLNSFISKAEMTEKGNFILRWNDGTPLNVFISYLYEILTKILVKGI